MISGINHLTFAVSDLARSFDFYRNVLGFRPLARWKTGAYFLCGETWICLITSLHEFAPQDYTHIAFSVAPENFPTTRDRLLEAYVKVWKQNTSEGESLYFLDPDGHKFELHASTWRDRIASTRVAPYAEMEFFD